MCGIGVAAAAVLKAAVVVEHLYHLYGNSMVGFEEFKIGNLVTAEVGNDAIIAEKLVDLACLLGKQ